MLAANPFDTELVDLFRQLAKALIESTPEHFKTITCQLTAQRAAGGQTALFYEIGSPEFPDESTTEPGETLHQAATRLVRHWSSGGETFPGLRITMTQETDGSWSNSIQRLDCEFPDEEVEDPVVEKTELETAEFQEACTCAAGGTGAARPWWKFW